MDAFDRISSILMVVFNIFGIVCALIFIVIVAFHRQCHTTTNLLVLNSVVAGFVSNLICGSQGIYQLTGDGNDILCILRGYLLYSATGLLYHTLCVQALHRLFVTVLATRRYLQSKRTIIMIVIAQWVISGCFVLPIFLGGRIKYNPGSRICLILVNDPYAFLYIGTWVYFFTMSMIVLIYILILRHMKHKSFSTTTAQRTINRHRQHREIRLYCRILLLIAVLFVMGIPYCVFFLLAMINPSSSPLPYADRICFLSICMGYSVSTLLSLLYTNGVRKIFLGFMSGGHQDTRRRQIHCGTNLTLRPVRVNVINIT